MLYKFTSEKYAHLVFTYDVCDGNATAALGCYPNLQLLERPCECGIEPPGFISHGVR